MIQDKVYANEGNKAVIGLIPREAVHILDIGCGRGDNASILKSQGKIVDGITFSSAEIEAAQKNMRHVYIFNLENGLPPEVFNHRYDAILCSHVLEHICWPEKLFNDIKTLLLASNGELVIALPNLMHYNTRIPLMLGNFNYSESGIMDKSHFKWYTYRSMTDLLISYGFQVKWKGVDGYLPLHSLLKYLPPTFYRALKKLLFGISKGFFGQQLLYKARL
jgi:SAM-dependent methyltransferase